MDTWKEKDESYVWHPYTPDPHLGPKALWASAKGAMVTDANGKAYFDSTSSWWAQLHGHCHPRLMEALRKQSEKLDHVLFAPHTHEVGIRLAEALVSQMAPPFQRVFYSDDGSTAVEAGLKMALQYFHNRGDTKRKHFLSLVEGYHGDTLGAVGVGYLHEFHHFFETAIQKGFQTVEPYCYRCPVSKQYPGCDIACLGSAHEALEKHGDEIAALIVEPLVMGAAGMVMYPKEYLESLVSACRKKGVLVIFDEVFTGFGRTGKMFALDHLGVKPDIVALSKGLTSGVMALGATVTTEEIYSAFRGEEKKKFYHGHTFSGNPLGCAVALESLSIFNQEGVLQRNQELESILAENVERFSSLPHVGEVRHMGMIWALELVRDKGSKALPAPPSRPGWSIAGALWEKGIWNRPLHNVLYLVPPYCTSAEQLREVLEALFEEVGREAHFS